MLTGSPVHAMLVLQEGEIKEKMGVEVGVRWKVESGDDYSVGKRGCYTQRDEYLWIYTSNLSP